MHRKLKSAIHGALAGLGLTIGGANLAAAQEVVAAPASPLLGERVVADAGVATAGSCGGIWDSVCRAPRMWVKIENPWLQRDVDNDIQLNAFTVGNAIGTTSLDQNEFHYRPGARVMVGGLIEKCANCDWALEGGFLGGFHHNKNFYTSNPPVDNLFGGLLLRTFPDDGNGQAVDGFLQRFDQKVEYSSDLNSAEVNWRHDYFQDQTLIWLFGLRYVRLDDRFKVSETGIVFNQFENFANSEAFRFTRVENNLIGLQIGVDWNSTPYDAGRANFGFFGRAGVYGNILNAETVFFATDSGIGPVAQSFDAGRTRVAGVFE
ncbi:MAG TPA: hypothetical protein VNC50_12780, partial [Planctomycetia bacterium]|nr:hypothetical protein [Planctomycetia bacterium]